MKISIIGAGQVGATLAMRILEKELGEVVLLDVVKGIPQGKALDLNEAGPLSGYEPRLFGTQDYGYLRGSDMVVITAGFPRQPGMSREELLAKNLDIVSKVTANIVSVSPRAIIIVVTNPLDLMTYAVYKISGFTRERVLGMGGVLDGARFAYFISDKLKVSVRDISPVVIGSHADTMVPLPRFTTVAGVPLTHLLEEKEIKGLVERTRKGGAEIVSLLGSGSAYYAPSAAALRLIESIVYNRPHILPCSIFLKGEYGLKDICLGVPVKLGPEGVREVIELRLNAGEQKLLRHSAGTVRPGVKDIDARLKNYGKIL